MRIRTNERCHMKLLGHVVWWVKCVSSIRMQFCLGPTLIQFPMFRFPVFQTHFGKFFLRFLSLCFSATYLSYSCVFSFPLFCIPVFQTSPNSKVNTVCHAIFWACRAAPSVSSPADNAKLVFFLPWLCLDVDIEAARIELDINTKSACIENSL